MNLLGEQQQWPERRPLLSQGLGALAPDLLALQEVTPTTLDDLFAGTSFHIVKDSRGKADGKGIAIISRWPIRTVHEIPQPRAADSLSASTAVIVELPPPLGPLLFVNHKPDWQLDRQRQREEQAVAVASYIEDLLADNPMPTVVAGDFDATPDSSTIRFWTGRQSLDHTSVCYADAWANTNPDDPGHTFTPTNAMLPKADDGIWARELGRRIDYVLVRVGQSTPSLDVTSCERIFTQPVAGHWVSDHFGLVADLAIPTPSGDQFLAHEIQSSEASTGTRAHTTVQACR